MVYLKDGLKNTAKTGGYIEYMPEFLSPVAVDAVAESALDSAEAAGDAVAGFGEFSSTNVIEEGVDETDFMKFDGEILYVVEQSSSPIYWIADDGAVAYYRRDYYLRPKPLGTFGYLKQQQTLRQQNQYPILT